MAGLDPAIQSHTKSFAVSPWMAASEGGHDVHIISRLAAGSTTESRQA
jgi:hypothetical protein